MTKHPLGKAGRNISKQKYDSVKGAMLDALRNDELIGTKPLKQPQVYQTPL